MTAYEESSIATTHSEYHDTLEVTGLPDGVSEGLIELYFEDSKSGGCADAIKDISFVRPGVARIQFTSDIGMLRERLSATDNGCIVTQLLSMGRGTQGDRINFG